MYTFSPGCGVRISRDSAALRGALDRTALYGIETQDRSKESVALELADVVVVDVQCVFQNLANVAKCFHTKLITTHPIAKMEQDNVVHIEFDEHHALEDAKRIVTLAIDNFAAAFQARAKLSVASASTFSPPTRARTYPRTSRPRISWSPRPASRAAATVSTRRVSPTASGISSPATGLASRASILPRHHAADS